MKLIFQIPGSFETRALQTLAYQRDIETFRASLENLPLYADHLRAGALPVGSVEFVREAMRLADIIEPEVMTYPDALLTNWAFRAIRSEEHTSELQSLMRISYAVFCLKKKTTQQKITSTRLTNTDSH